EVEIKPKGHDPERARVCEEFALLTHGKDATGLVTGTAHGFLLEGALDRTQAQRLTDELLVDPLVETGRLRAPTAADLEDDGCATVLLKPGVMDPVALSVVNAARDLVIPVESVRSVRRYFGVRQLATEVRAVLFGKVLANEAIEQVIEGPLKMEHLSLGAPY